MSDAPMRSLGKSFSEVMARARAGDRDALATMYRCYQAQIAAAVRRQLPKALRSKYDTMDLAQSVFVEVMCDLSQLDDRGERAFLALLSRRAQNKVRDKLRRHLGKNGRRAERRLATDADRARTGGGEHVGAEDLDEFAKLRRVLDGLGAPEREILRLRAQGASFVRVASETGLVSADAARKRHARIVEDLRTRWTTARR